MFLFIYFWIILTCQASCENYPWLKSHAISYFVLRRLSHYNTVWAITASFTWELLLHFIKIRAAGIIVSLSLTRFCFFTLSHLLLSPPISERCWRRGTNTLMINEICLKLQITDTTRVMCQREFCIKRSEVSEFTAIQYIKNIL